jgi:hypothetical protein
LGKLTDPWDFEGNDPYPDDVDGHGSGVSSIAAANTDNARGMAGVCWNCLIMPLRAGIYSNAADALVWATDHGARIVNVSQGDFSPSSTYLRALAYAYDAGVVQVYSSGNEDATPIKYPARYIETIAVGATKSDDWRADPFTGAPGTGSNYGPRLDVVAPGDIIVGADHEGGYAMDLRGTSFSSPLVAGLAGLIESVYPSAGREEVRHLIRSGAQDQVSTDPDDTPGFDEYYGWGRVNMDRTLQATEASMSLRVAGAQNTRVYLDTGNPLADSYDFIRGDLASLSETYSGVDLGDVVCLENDSLDADTAGDEDTTIPDPGEAFFYVARFNAAPGAGSYGGSSVNRDRRVKAHWPNLAWSAQGNQADAWYGVSAAPAGDVNGDGYDDVIVGADHHDDSLQDEGAVYLYLGSPSGLSQTADWSVHGGIEGERLGRDAASAGDVNGDGYDDLIIGAPFHDGAAGSDVGRVIVFHGSASGPGSLPDWEIEGTQGGARLGFRVSPAGDVNDDGWDDVIIGEYLYDDGPFADSGRAHVYFGSPDGLTASWTATIGQSEAWFGGGVAGVGDVNCDGWDDVAIGADGYDSGQSDEGAVFVYYGSSLGLGLSPDEMLEINSAGALFGRSVERAGDVDGDTCADIVVGAREYSNGEDEEGGVFLFLGSDTGIETTPAWSWESNQEYARLGVSASTAGDLNGDGWDDLVVGADWYDATRTDEGRVWVFLGSSSGLSLSPDWHFETGQTHAWLGWRGAGAGDVNGDAYDDLIIGAFRHDEPDVDEGAAYVFHGPLGLPPSTTDCDAD